MEIVAKAVGGIYNYVQIEKMKRKKYDYIHTNSITYTDTNTVLLDFMWIVTKAVGGRAD